MMADGLIKPKLPGLTPPLSPPTLAIPSDRTYARRDRHYPSESDS